MKRKKGFQILNILITFSQLPGIAPTRSTDGSPRCPSHHRPSSQAGPLGKKIVRACLLLNLSRISTTVCHSNEWNKSKTITSAATAKAGRSRVSPTNTFMSSVPFLDNYRGARLIVPRFWKPKFEQIGGLNDYARPDMARLSMKFFKVPGRVHVSRAWQNYDVDGQLPPLLYRDQIRGES